MSIRAALALSVAVSLAAQVPAQFRERNFGKLHLPRDQGTTSAAVFGDVDGDGRLDLVLGNHAGVSISLYLGDGAGRFREAAKGQVPAAEGPVAAVALGDVDGDGDLDMALGMGLSALPCRLYLNDGKGTFADGTAGRMPTGTDFTSVLALKDVDGDGDLDLVCGRYERQNLLLRNDGKGVFTDATAGRMPVDSDPTVALALGDLDGDGDLDLLCGGQMQNRLYLNDGTGGFSDVTSARLPSSSASCLALGDVDGDGDLDLVCGTHDQNLLFRNDGKGFFTDATAGSLPAQAEWTMSLALADLDGDGCLDLVVGNSGYNRLYLNDGKGRFAEGAGSRMPPSGEGTLALAVGDVDGDGDRDLVCGNHHCQNRLLLNDGKAGFTCAMPENLPERRDCTRALASGDVDGDGDLDLICGNIGDPNGAHKQNRLFVNDGKGAFADATAARMPAIEDGTRALGLGDLDRDGDLDLICGNDGDMGGEQNRLLLNDGKGSFADATAGRMPANGDRTRALVLGDVDGDGDLDLIFGNGGQNRLCLNDGQGNFADATAGRLPMDTDWTHALALGDVDGDGDLDLIVGNDGPNRLYLNDGQGSFADATAGRLPTDFYRTRALVLGDVDGDGDLDLLRGTDGCRLYVNDGKGVFTDVTGSRMPRSWVGTSALVLGDVDRDGRPDLVCGTEGQNRLLLNDGNGAFLDATAAWMPADTVATYALALGDLDGDGDPDLVCGKYIGQGLLFNFISHLEAPYLAVLGRSWRIEIHDAVGHPRQLSVVFPFLAPEGRPCSIPPYGIWALDPGRMVPLPMGVIAAPATRIAQDLAVPNQAALAGMGFGLQAVVLRWPAAAAFTRVAVDRIVP